MGKLWSLFRQLFSAQGNQPPAPKSGKPLKPRKVDDYLDLLQNHPGTRITTIRLLGRHVTDDNVMFTKEHIETEDDDGNARQLDVFDARTCSFGHCIDQEIRATSVCQLGGELMCSMKISEKNSEVWSCQAWCCVCGKAACAIHRKTYVLGNGSAITYCSRCKWIHWWRRFWGLYRP